MNLSALQLSARDLGVADAKHDRISKRERGSRGEAAATTSAAEELPVTNSEDLGVDGGRLHQSTEEA